jgi:hypothetical protein
MRVAAKNEIVATNLNWPHIIAGVAHTTTPMPHYNPHQQPDFDNEPQPTHRIRDHVVAMTCS